MPGWLVPALVAGGSMGFGGLAGSQKKKQKTSQSGTVTQKLPSALSFQQTGEDYLTQLLTRYGTTGYNPYTAQAGLAGTTSDWMQQLLKTPYQVSPEQSALLEEQTRQRMVGLTGNLDEWRRGAASRAEQKAITRGIPRSDVARGMEANVEAQYGRALAEGYNQAMQQEITARLDLPAQNLRMAGGLQQQYSSPLMQMLYNVGMSRLQGPRDQATTGTGMTTSGGGWQGAMQGAGQGLGLLNQLFVAPAADAGTQTFTR